MILKQLFLAGLVTLVSSGVYAASSTNVNVAEDTFYFDIIGLNEPVSHTFKFRNLGSEPLHITNVMVTQPLVLAGVTSVIAPGEEGNVSVILATPRLAGPFEGMVRAHLTNADPRELQFQVRGNLTPSIECLPMPALFLATHRDEKASASVEIVNNEQESLRIESVEPTSDRLKAQLVEIEPQKRFRLDVTLSGEGAAGQQREYIKLKTSLKKQPLLKIQANTLVKERVALFPPTVEFGKLNASDLRAGAAIERMLNQTLMVYQRHGTNFQVSADCDLPFVRLAVEQAKTRDKAEVRLELDIAKLTIGEFSGKVRLRTNDKEFSELTVPVAISVLAPE